MINQHTTAKSTKDRLVQSRKLSETVKFNKPLSFKLLTKSGSWCQVFWHVTSSMSDIVRQMLLALIRVWCFVDHL